MNRTLEGRRIALSEKDGYKLSTVAIDVNTWYGDYETALIYKNGLFIVIEGYDTEEEAIKGHDKYFAMSYEELLDVIDMMLGKDWIKWTN